MNSRPLNAGEALGNLVETYELRTFAEIGVAKGKTAIYLMENHDIMKYYLIDKDLTDSFFDKVDNELRQRFIFLRMLSLNASKEVPDNSLDICFIDADHVRYYVYQDCQIWLPKVKKGGILCGHDYGNPKHPGVERAVTQFFHNGDYILQPVKNCSIWIHFKKQG